MLDPAEFQTERLDIRPFSAADLPAFYAFNSSPEARRFMGGVVSRAETEASIRAHIRSVETTGLGARAVVERSNGAVVGYCGLQEFAETQEIELFYGYLPTAWGRGIATEAARATLLLGFRCLSVGHVVAIVHPQNVASIRVLEKLAFRLVGTYPHPRLHIEHLRFHLPADPDAA